MSLPSARRPVGTGAAPVGDGGLRPPRALVVAGPRVVLALAALVLGAALLLDPPGLWWPTWFVLLTGVSIVLGEVVQGLLVSRHSAPISTAAAVALAMTPAVTTGSEYASASRVIALLGLAFLASQVIAWLVGRPTALGPVAARFLGAATTAVACRGITTEGRGSLLQWAWGGDLSSPAAATLLLLCALLGWLVERSAQVLVQVGARRVGAPGAQRALLLDSVTSGAVAASGPLIAVSYPVLGLLALPLYVLPVTLVLLSQRRYLAVQRAQGEALVVLSRIPAIAAGGRPGHSKRVADLSVEVGRRLGLPEGRLHSVERAALLHDIGQVGLEVPLEHGMTIDASPQSLETVIESSRRIARAALDTPGLEEVLAAVHEPYRHQLEMGRDLPVEARIIKVVNAYDDLTEGSHGQRVVDLALERLHLGLGYEYDPEVVRVLDEVVTHG
ncbi:HD-GYP domain-containing protein [Janibacter melonis]|uniref:HD-GYP domain-containing protein n=1 Tax=Janibacter melonis TaxID=262209 RepID=UPI000A3ECC0B|nr:HD domain-containing phosphohydrolase [Janibacter melonis]